MRHLIPAGLVLAFGLTSVPARAADDLASLRAEIEALRAAYEARLQALEARLQAAERAGSAPAATAQAATPAAAPAPSPAPLAAAAGAPAATANANTFNPALSLILSGLYTHTSRDPKTPRSAPARAA